MVKIGVLGAGVSGLSIGKLLSSQFEVEILEKNAIHGGIARTKTVDGVSYHTTGGHCFNSKHEDVLEFVFGQIMPKHLWHKINRNAVIKFKGHEINYPIEFAVKQIFLFDKKLAINITKDFLNTNDNGSYLNLEDWFRKKFGDTLAEEYFVPYNRKIWNRPPNEMNPTWVEGKLPIPNAESFFESLIDSANDKMPHSEFYYPNSNNQNTFLDKLAEGLNIKYNEDVNSLYFEKTKKKWIVNNKYDYDILINTLPLNELPSSLSDCPKEILDAASKLRYNKVSNMLWESRATNRTWTYIPDNYNFFHRYIHIGNFFEPSKNYTITEAIGEKSYDEMVLNGKNDPFLIKPIDFNVSNHAYVVFDDNYKQSTSMILEYLKTQNIYSVGRFGEWEYYNMDICIKRAIELKTELISKYFKD